MELEWMGKYRNIVEKCIRYGNAYAQSYKTEQFYDFDIPFSPAQLQVLEYILENEEKNEPLGAVAKRLGISQSAFSKNVQKMVDKGLLEKYHLPDNRKTVLIRSTDLGREAYGHYAAFIFEHCFKQLFEIMDTIPMEYVERFAYLMDVAAGPQTDAAK